MDGVPALRFASAARNLGAAARAAGLAVPSFRSPPRVSGARRTIRRLPGGAVISVRIRGRAYDDVVADMIDGVLAANRLGGPAARRQRAALTSAVAEPTVDLAGAERAERAERAGKVRRGEQAERGAPGISAPRGTVAEAPRPSLPAEARMAERQTQAA